MKTIIKRIFHVSFAVETLSYWVLFKKKKKKKTKKKKQTNEFMFLLMLMQRDLL